MGSVDDATITALCTFGQEAFSIDVPVTGKTSEAVGELKVKLMDEFKKHMNGSSTVDEEGETPFFRREKETSSRLQTWQTSPVTASHSITLYEMLCS